MKTEIWSEHRADCPGEDLCTLNSRRPSSVIALARGWGPGTVIEGDEGYGPARIEICYLGQTVVARSVDGGRENNWTLRCRCWGRVADSAFESVEAVTGTATGTGRLVNGAAHAVDGGHACRSYRGGAGRVSLPR